MEIILEIIFELYLELMMLIIPEEKAVSKTARFFVAVFALIMLFAVIGAFIAGIVLIGKGSLMGGIILIVVAVAVSLAQIIAGFFVYSHESKNILNKLD